jgi:hypothetical protein
MPDDMRPGGGRFPIPPSRYEIDQFLAFVKQTGEPELYEKLSWNAPDKSAVGHKLLCSFYVPLSRRPGDDYIPCCSCNSRPKYSHGYLVWSPDGEMRIVGSCCGPKYFGEDVFRRMEEEARQQQIEQDHQYFLIDQLAKIPDMIRAMEALRPCCKQYDLISAALQSRVPTVVKKLSRIAKQFDGVLSVAKERDEELVGAPAGFRGSADGEKSRFDIVNLGRIEGRAMLRKGADATERLDRVVDDLQKLVVADALDAVCHMDRQQAAASVMLLKSCVVRAIRLHHRLTAMPTFFSRSHLANLRHWGRHPDNDFQLQVKFDDKFAYIEHGTKEHLRVPIGGPIQVPDLPGFEC